MQRVVFCLLLCCTLCHGTPNAPAAQWLLLELTASAAELVDAADQPQPLRASEPVVAADPNVAVYYHLNGKTILYGMPRDPRHDWGASHHPGRGLVHSEGQRAKGHLAMVIPSEATHLTVHMRDLTPGGTDPRRPVRQTLPVRASRAAPKRRFQPQATADAAEVDILQMVGAPTDHLNLVFLSGGFTKAEKPNFQSAADEALNFLEGNVSLGFMARPMLPTPWDRYMPNVNVFSVFEASAEHGASVAVDAYGHPGTGPVRVANNLGCAYGPSSPGVLECEAGAMHRLASRTSADPARTVLIALVNSATPGFSAVAGGRLSVYIGQQLTCAAGAPGCTDYGFHASRDNEFLSVFMRAFGHAVAGLADESAYNTSEPQRLPLPNCHWSATEQLPWQHWLDAGEVDPPAGPCGFANYVRPTGGRCLMGNANAPELCAVCVEHTIRTVYEATARNAVPGPRCPREHEVMVVLHDAAVHYLAIAPRFYAAGVTRRRPRSYLAPYDWPAGTFPADHPRRNGTTLPLRTDGGNVKIQWLWPGTAAVQKDPVVGNLDLQRTHLPFTGKELGLGVHRFRVQVTDRSRFVNAEAYLGQSWIAKMALQETVFEVRVEPPQSELWRHCSRAALAPLDAATFQREKAQKSFAECPAAVIRPQQQDPTAPGILPYYCGVCKPGHVCDNNYTVRAFVDPPDALGPLPVSADRTIAFVAPMFVVGLLLFLGLSAFAVYWYKTRPHLVLPISGALEISRYFILALDVLLMVLTIGVVGIASWTENELSAFGYGACSLAMTVAAFMYITTFVSYAAAWFYHRQALLCCNVLMSAFVVLWLWNAVFLAHVQSRHDSLPLQESLTQEWVRAVSADPARMCHFQHKFQCSGFTVACAGALHSQCPTGCPHTNRNHPNPCYQVVRGELRTVLGPFGTGMALATFLAVCVLVVHWIGYGLLWDRHRQTAARLKKRSALGLAHGDDPWAADVGVAILKNLTTPEKQALMEEYWKMDDGLELRKMEWGAVRRFYRQTLDVQLTEEQVLGAVLCRRLRWLCP